MNQLRDFDPQELQFLDDILDTEFPKTGTSYSNSYYNTEFGIPLDSFKRLKNTVCDILESEGLAQIQKSRTTAHTILRFTDNVNCTKFIDNGSISEHLKREHKEKERLKDHQQDIMNNAKPKDWYKRPEILIPSIIGLLTIALSTATPLYIYKQEKRSYNTQTEEKITILDSVNRSYRNQYDSLASKQKKEVFLKLDSLETSFNKYLINNPPITGKEETPK